MNPQEEFRSFAAARGYELPPDIQPGKFLRFSTNGKTGDSAGWARMFEDAEGGIVGCWRTGEEFIWQAKRDRQFTPEEKREWLAKIEQQKREAKEQRERDEAEAAARSKAIWEAAKPAPADHSYLKRKNVAPSGLKVYQGAPLTIRDMDCTGALILPFRNSSGEIRSLEFIGMSGEKRFLPGGNYKAAYYAIGKAGEKRGDVLCIGEGFATMASVFRATNYPARIAGTRGNLLAVAQAMRERLPEGKLILCADNDRHTVCERHKKDGATEALSPFHARPEWCRCNPGLTDAIEAARAVRGLLAIPEPKSGTDFNDLAGERGPDAVKAAITAAQVPPVAQTPAATPKANGGDPGAAVDVIDGWPKPQALPSQLPPVLPFSFDLLPAGLRPWIEDVAERIQCPPEFPAVGALVALGSVIGRTIAVRPRERDDWHEFPNLWGMIVGSPGVLKSPALTEALRPLRKLEAEAAELHGGTLAAWQADREGGKIRREAARAKARQAAMKGGEFDAAALVAPDDEEEPKARRYIVNDCTVPALGEVLRSSPNGVLAYRDELSGLLKSMEREGNEGDRAFYLSAYSGKEAHVFDRIGRGLNLRIDHCCISMLGSIQPAVIGSYLREAIAGGGSDGLLSRFSLLVWPDVSGEWRNVDRFPETAARQAVNALFERMKNLEPDHVAAEREEGEAPFLRLSISARECFVEWRERYEGRQREGEDHPALVAHFAKYRKLVPALALIFHLADNGTGPISEAALLRALGWAEILESHARRAYASIQQARAESARALLAKIRAGHVPNPIRLRDVYLKGWSGLGEPEEARQAADLLHELDYLSRETIQTGGRSATVYWVSPRVKE